VTFFAGTSAGWDFHERDGDIVRDNTVDVIDLSVLVQHWLAGECDSANQWCDGADIDGDADVDFVDYALMAENWSLEGGENVLLQTIYGTAQDANDSIIANNSRALSQNEGMAMAFIVPSYTVLDKVIFKCWDIEASNDIRIRLFNVTGKNYLNYLHTMTKADPGSGSPAIIDLIATVPSPVPYHLELGDERKYTDLVINFESLEITAGEYLITFDAMGPDNTWGNIIRGTQAEAENMSEYPGGVSLPKRATVTTGSTATGSTYYYELENASATSYTSMSNLFAFQVLAPAVNHAPQVNAGRDQEVTHLDSDAVLDGMVSDDGLLMTVTTQWTKESGPGAVTFNNECTAHTTARFSAAGTYVLKLAAGDGEFTSFDEVTINVPPNPPITEWYRIVLHCHTTNSDGTDDPNTMFCRYRDNGPYAGVLVADHDYITNGSPWTTSTFLGINGVEVTYGKSHVIAFGVTATPGWLSNPGANLQEHINRAISAGGLPIVAHPKWTMEVNSQKVTDLPQQIINSTGCSLFEIYNHVCEYGWGWGFSEGIYDQVLSAGKQMYCVTADDSHSVVTAGFTSIFVGADEFSVPALKTALQNGYFYACRSTTKWDPGIKLLNYQVSGNNIGDTITIEATSAAQKLEFIGCNGTVLKTVNGNSASYTITGTEMYVRARITNTEGDYTWTQPVFVVSPPP